MSYYEVPPEISDEEIPEMVEYFLRSTVDIDSILSHPIFENKDKFLIISAFQRILFKYINELGRHYIYKSKNEIFELIKEQKPYVEEEIFSDVMRIIERIPILFRFQTDESLMFWDWPYTEPSTGITLTYGEWAKLFHAEE